MFKSKKSKIIATAAAAALAVGAAGIGAVTTLNTTLAGNHFDTTASTTPPADGSGLLVISGQPMVKTFSGTTNNESVTATWTLRNKGENATKWDGAMQNLKVADQALAKSLTLEFGEGDGTDTTKWYDAGTLDAPKSYDQALGYASSTNTIDGAETLSIPVRVTLKDPTALIANGGSADQKLELNSNFVVNYVNPDVAPAPGE